MVIMKMDRQCLFSSSLTEQTKRHHLTVMPFSAALSNEVIFTWMRLIRIDNPIGEVYNGTSKIGREMHLSKEKIDEKSLEWPVYGVHMGAVFAGCGDDAVYHRVGHNPEPQRPCAVWI